MSESFKFTDAADPLLILGLTREASEEEIRGRYLELVKQFPPEREPERFREIHAAYQASLDPLLLADKLLAMPDESPPEWSDVIDCEKSNPPTLSVDFLLSLGNRDNRAKKTTSHE